MKAGERWVNQACEPGAECSIPVAMPEDGEFQGTVTVVVANGGGGLAQWSVVGARGAIVAATKLFNCPFGGVSIDGEGERLRLDRVTVRNNSGSAVDVRLVVQASPVGRAGGLF